jgi:hypothetical protein
MGRGKREREGRGGGGGRVGEGSKKATWSDCSTCMTYVFWRCASRKKRLVGGEQKKWKREEKCKCGATTTATSTSASRTSEVRDACAAHERANLLAGEGNGGDDGCQLDIDVALLLLVQEPGGQGKELILVGRSGGRFCSDCGSGLGNDAETLALGGSEAWLRGEDSAGAPARIASGGDALSESQPGHSTAGVLISELFGLHSFKRRLPASHLDRAACRAPATRGFWVVKAVLVRCIVLAACISSGGDWTLRRRVSKRGQ